MSEIISYLEKLELFQNNIFNRAKEIYMNGASYEADCEARKGKMSTKASWKDCNNLFVVCSNSSSFFFY